MRWSGGGEQEERVEMEEDGLGLESPCDFTFDFRIGVAWGLSILYGSYLEISIVK
jgi:hypothetical protein